MLSRLLIGLLVVCGYVNAQQLTVPGAINTTTYQMGDDGSVNVPLPFTFNYYGKSFNDSWMYDNGIISFVKPGTEGAVHPWEWSPPSSLNKTTGNYFIAPLWVDLAPVPGTVYSTTGDGTYLKYEWKNISEYYSGGTRLNSFSSTIKPDGSISTSYYSLNLESSNMLVGTVGDASKGEINQLYSASFGTKTTTGMLPNWNYTTVNPCDTNPLYSPTCSGYSNAISKIMPPSRDNVEPTTTTEPIVSETTSVAAPQTTVTPVATSNVDTSSQVTVAPTTRTTNRETTNSSGTSLGLSVIARNQQREQSIVSSAVQNAISSAEASSMQSQQEAMSVASMAASVGSSMSVSTSAQTQSGTGIRVQTNNNQVGVAIGNTSLTSLTENNVSTYNNMLTDRTNPLNEYVEPKATMPNNQKFVGSTVNRNVGNNEVAGGVDINKMALAPTGYNDYLNLTLRDSAFYAPKEVYKNQKNVDNARALRQLTNDGRHQEMVEQQYRR